MVTRTMFSMDVVAWGEDLARSSRLIPMPEGQQILVKMRYCGLCHSDVHIRDGYFNLGAGKRFYMTQRGMQLPVTMGHEPYGEVVEVGDQANSYLIGKKCLVYPWSGCGTCAQCVLEKDNLCAQPQFLGIQKAGGYGEYLLVENARYLLSAEGIKEELVPVLACSALTAYSALKKCSHLAPNQPILLIGGGGLGLMALNILKYWGFDKVIFAELDQSKWSTSVFRDSKSRGVWRVFVG
ncbi:MAG: alcohol dehydrogenase catalytic domain-containing protein, partial [Gammaproteobacteria bacterium]|nr:alcohol dehydrogenase catalytic domain-containing protein [Gammaproteobacteria bacterium]